MPVACIASAHDSGPSIVATLLNRLIGSDETKVFLVNGHPKEKIKFARINERLLSVLGGAWDYPPRFPSNWTTLEQVIMLKPESMREISEFQHKDFWGWEDPVNSLTLEYWNELIPCLKTVVVIRNPLDIINLLGENNFSSFEFGSQLTARYFNALRYASTNQENRLVVHYDSVIANPENELLRIAEFLDLNANIQDVKKTCETIFPDTNHTSRSVLELAHSNLPMDLVENYVSLCQQAGRHYAPLFIKDWEKHFDQDLVSSSWSISMRIAKIRYEQNNLISDHEKEILCLKDIISNKDLQLMRLQENIGKLENMLEQCEKILGKKDENIMTLFNRLREQEKTIEGLSGRGNVLVSGRAKLLISQKFQRLLLWLRVLAPRGSSRERFARSMMRLLKINQQMDIPAR